MEVRQIRDNELDVLLELYRHLNPDDPVADRTKINNAWQETLANPRFNYFGAFFDNRLIATCSMIIIANLTRSARPYALIENVVTHAAHRRQGAGKAVLTAAMQSARAAGCYKIMLMSGRDESVCQFYEQVGFSRQGKQAFVIRYD